MLLQMLAVACLYHLSERRVEEMTTYPLAIKEFVGLAVDELAPDHSTLSVCKGRGLETICEAVLRRTRAVGIRWARRRSPENAGYSTPSPAQHDGCAGCSPRVIRVGA
jgi:hypothetical protein